MATTDTSTWNLVDASRLDPSHASLPTKERRELYEAITQRFRINKDGTMEGDISDKKFATRQHSMPSHHENFVFILFNIFVGLYFIPHTIFAFLTYYFYINAAYISLFITIIIGLYIQFHPVKLWRSFLQYPYYYVQYNYFSYRLVYHSSIKDFISHQLMGTAGYKSLIFLGVPHAIFPYAIQLMPPLAKDLFNKPILGAMADVLYYLPGIRQLFLWAGSISASKQSIITALAKGYNVGLVADGIAGMFVESDNTENILLQKRKGIAKLALQTGVSVVPSYGFGNTDLFQSYFDSYGIMKTLSRKLKMSLILFAGKYYTLAPERRPLYMVMGPVVENPNNGTPIKQPTQQQIDEYHDQILLSLQTLFDSHKGFYGWEHKKIRFI